MFKHWPDWLIRALKTFVQAFLAVFIPTLTALLKEGLPQDWDATWVTLVSAGMAGLAAGISAVWNIALEVHNDLKTVGGVKHDQ